MMEHMNNDRLLCSTAPLIGQMFFRLGNIMSISNVSLHSISLLSDCMVWGQCFILGKMT